MEKTKCLIVGSGPAALILTDLQKHEVAEEVKRSVGIIMKELKMVEGEVEL